MSQKNTQSLSQLAQSVSIGRYKHFKGGMYEVIGVGRMSEEGEREMVVYKNLETGLLWIRPLEMFLEHVERDGYSGPRFTLIDKKTA